VGECAASTCTIVSCETGWVNANGTWVDGCEYECTMSAPSESPDDSTCSDGFDNDCDGRTDVSDPDCGECVPEFCDALDNDCDGLTDEDFDTDFDVMNCGGCGTACAGRTHAVPICILGSCEIQCEAGWEDRNLNPADGCEVTCLPATEPNEVACDGRDNDCDGTTDEDYLPYRCGGGPCERNSICFHGTTSCEPRDPPAAMDTTCDNVDDDCDGTVDEDWIATGCVGACIDTATCTEGVPQCGPPAANDTTCDGIDDDCDGTADEDWVSSPCGVGACQRMSMCEMGLFHCVPGTSLAESCNGMDDDCDGTTDNNPPAPALLCPVVDNGTAGCSAGTCVIVACTAGWADADGIGANGCECALEPAELGPGSPGESCFNPINLGTLPDDGGTGFEVRGKIAPSGDDDWFSFVGQDSADDTCDAYNVDVRFAPGGNPGTAFRIDVYRGTCDSTTCTNIPDRYSWYTDFSERTGPSPLGECQCRTANVYDYNLCSDNTITYTVRVYRDPSAALDCAEYVLRITNGAY
jgi:hypothetical protein